MREKGYDLTNHDSKSLDDLPNVDSDAVMTMGCGDERPLLRAKRRDDWNIPVQGSCRRRSFARFATLSIATCVRCCRTFEQDGGDVKLPEVRVGAS
jgi:hypothetical protein